MIGQTIHTIRCALCALIATAKSVGRGPPSALDHRVNYIWYVIPDIRDFPLEILRLIGNFITPWWWPGRGSRTVPVAEATRTSRDVWYGRGPRNGRSPDPVQPRFERRRRSPAPIPGQTPETPGTLMARPQLGSLLARPQYCWLDHSSMSEPSAIRSSEKVTCSVRYRKSVISCAFSINVLAVSRTLK